MLEELFYALLETSIITGIIVLILFFLSPLLNRAYAAKWKYWVWLILAVRLLLPVSISLPQAPVQITVPETHYAIPVTQNQQAANTKTENTEHVQNSATEQTFSAAEPAAKSVSLLQIAMMIWLVGFFAFLLHQLIAYKLFRKQAMRWSSAIKDIRVTREFERLSSLMGIKRQIAPLISEKISSPMMTGFIKPLLILPHANYTDMELSYIFKHELTHFKRHDLWYKLLLLFANAVHWFNPLVYLMFCEAGKDLELSCDDEVTKGASFDERKEYSETILASIRRQKAHKTILSTYFYGGTRTLKERFQNILNMGKKRKGTIALLMVLILVGVAGALVACNRPSDIETSVMENVVDAETPRLEESITASSPDEAARLFSGAIMYKDIDYFENDCNTNISDQAIDSVTLLETFDDLMDGTVCLYELYYRIKPEKPDKVLLAGGMQMEDGWLTETGYGNFPLILGRDGEYTFIGNMNLQSFERFQGDRRYAVTQAIDYNGYTVSPDAGCDVIRDTLITAIEDYFEGSGYMPELNAQESRVYGFDWGEGEDAFTLRFTAGLASVDDGVFPQEPLAIRYDEISDSYDLTALAQRVTVQSKKSASGIQVRFPEAEAALALRQQLAKQWAEAVKSGDGSAQYDLLSEERKAALYDYFKSHHWDTDQSSPWVEGYEIEVSGDNAIITYEYATSDGFAGYYEQTLTFAEENGELRTDSFSDPEYVETSSIPRTVIALLEKNGIELSAGVLKDGMYSHLTVSIEGREHGFDWQTIGEPAFLPELGFFDVDGDGEGELIVILCLGKGTGILKEEIHVLNTEDFSEITVSDPLLALHDRTIMKITEDNMQIQIDQKPNVFFRADEVDSELAQRESWFDAPAIGSIVDCSTQNNGTSVRVAVQISPAGLLGEFVLTYKCENNQLEIDEITFAGYIDSQTTSQ